ncbi:MAG: trimethylamine methyltransferase family protein [Desulfobacula sp.]|uniref:trimethylamine methyltransferase family protein n=1 Tax=Desulfobacula sp. TaxID=2593537 RepID=UPI0025B7CA4B|nr:trimethylamine methyltransferase family protein [Desulfobacula sp.]MCD4720514.1 trimethylamine methyltransferase family protein [Desulfobacula sp.]
MIQTNITSKASPRFRMLTEDQVERIKRAAFEVLEKVGFKVLHAGVRKMLRSAGAIVQGESVKVPEFIVQGCLSTAPKGWILYDRQGRRALDVSGRNSYYGTSTASPNTKDALTGEYHETRVEDLARAAKVADALENIDWVMPMGSAQDVPAMAAELHEFFATVTNTIKPIVFLAYSPRGTELIYDMAAEVAGGTDKLREKPFLVLYPETISPLIMPKEVADRILIAADRCLPQMMGPTIQPGATGPVTMAGAVAQGVAESMFCIVVAQLRRQGCPVGLGCNFGILDMANALMSIGSPEMSLALSAQAEVIQSMGLPTWGLAGATDAKSLDAQAGAEAAYHILAQGLSGLNLIHDVGYMDMSMACAVEQLVVGNDIIGMTKRFLQGFEVSDEHLAMEVISQVGPGGHYLQQHHTMNHFRNELWRSKVFTRQPFETWKEDGSKDVETRTREEIRRILETHKTESLPGGVLTELERIKTKGEKELTGK